MLCSEAIRVAGCLSAPSKVGASYSIPAKFCKTGQRLRKNPNSVCAKCYAHNRNRYAFPSVRKAMLYRYHALTSPAWVDAMVTQIGNRPYFRWHDSGDLQGLRHLSNIVEVCKRTPNTKHWLPTKEWEGGEGDKKIIEQWQAKHGEFPPNLVVRKCTYYVDQDPRADLEGTYCSVTTDKNRATCPATRNKKGTCESWGCRQCWDPTVRLVRYMEH